MHEPWEHQLVDEDRVMFVDAVVVAILVHRDAADRGNQIDAVGTLEIPAQFDHEHPAVAVERDLRWILDRGIRQHRFHPVAWRELQAFRLFGGRQRQHRRFRRQIGFRVRRVVCVGSSAGTGSAIVALNRSTILRVRRWHEPSAQARRDRQHGGNDQQAAEQFSCHGGAPGRGHYSASVQGARVTG